jgi:hypothetical protein
MNVDAELLACMRAEYDCLREDLKHIERGEWRGVSPFEVQLVRNHMQRMAVLVVLNDLPASKTH